MRPEPSRLLLLGLLLLGAAATSQLDSESVEIIHTGCYHGNEVSEGSEGRWDALYPRGEGFELVSRTVQVEPCRDFLDNDPSKITGRVVMIEEDGVLAPAPLFLVKGMDKVGSQPVGIVTAYPERGSRSVSWHAPYYRQRYLPPGERLKLSLAKTEYTLRAEGRLDPKRPTYDRLVIDYRLILVDPKGRSQDLLVPARFAEDGMPQLVWAGDLDRDGKLDLYMDLTDHYNVTNYVLFLSSHAGRNELLKRVASRRYVGC